MNAAYQTDLIGKFAKACDLLRRCSRKSVLAALIIAYVLVLFMLLPAITDGGQVVPLDLRFWYDPAVVYATFDALGEAGRHRYMVGALTLDVLYPLVYSCMFAVWLTLLLPHDTRLGCALRLLPFAILTADLMENISIAAMLAQYPEQMETLARVAPVFTACKWTLAALVIASTLVLTLQLVVRKLLASTDPD